MRKILLFIIVILSGVALLATLAPASADEPPAPRKSKISWYYADFPPLTIPYGPNAGKGYADRQRQMLIDRLNDYEHEFVVASFKRITQDIQLQKQVCCATLLKTPDREAFIEFSIPIRLVHNNGVIIRKLDRAMFEPYLDANGAIVLARAIEDNSLTLGIASGRAYATELSTVITKIAPRQNIYERAGTDVFDGLLSMLTAGRVSYILGYPTEAQYAIRNRESTMALAFFLIAEMKEPYILAYVGCPKNEWGAAVIRQIDVILKEIRTSPKFLGFYEDLLDEESLLQYQRVVHTKLAQ